MIDTTNILVLAAIIALQFLGPAYFLGRAIRSGELRVRFSLRALFVLVTIAAVCFGVCRLPFPWLFKCLMLWGVLMCATGLALVRRPPFPGRSANSDRPAG